MEDTKPISIQCLNIDCPRCGANPSFECRSFNFDGAMTIPHQERVRALKTLIADSQNDWLLRKILRERNFTK